MKNYKGFTLVELLVAISIIGIISAVGLTTYNAAQIRGRDAKRKQDLRAISVSLEIYRQRNGRYPCTHWVNSFTNTNPTSGGTWIYDWKTTQTPTIPGTVCNGSKPDLDQNYINILPKDPINTGGNPWVATSRVYGYRAYECNTVGDFYVLMTQLENTNDPDRLELSDARFCDGIKMWGHPTIGFTSPVTFVVVP